MTASSNTRWQMLDHAMQHYQTYIAGKEEPHSLTIIDLLHISNFKGGNASITEPENTLGRKLKNYEKLLAQIAESFNDKSLRQLNERETTDLISQCGYLSSLATSNNTKIRGFGISYGSALLSAHFIDLVPILDRRVLNGAAIKVEYNSQKQVKNISQHYGKLIRACRAELLNRTSLSLRELDREWFNKTL